MYISTNFLLEKKPDIVALGRKTQVLCSKFFVGCLKAEGKNWGCAVLIHCALSLLSMLLTHEPPAQENSIQTPFAGVSIFRKKKSDLQDHEQQEEKPKAIDDT